MRTPHLVTITLAAVAAAVVLSACAPVGTRELHEAVLIEGDGAERIRWSYGSADTLPLDGAELALGSTVGDAAEETPFAVPGARTVDDAPLLRDTFELTSEAPLSVARIPLTTDLRLVTSAEIPRSYYFDGRRWFELPRDVAAGRTVSAVPRPVTTPLRGIGDLTPAEADAIAAGLAADESPLVVALLGDDGSEATLPDELAASAPDGLDEYRHTALWVQRGLDTDASAYRAPARRGLFEVVARGDQGNDPGSDRFVLLRDRDQLRSFWNEVHASSFSPPPLPEVSFGRETLLGVRLAERPSGGYGIEFDDVVREGEQLFVELRLTEPDEGAMTTSALTTPWTMVRVLGVDASVAWFRDPDDGALFAVAREDDAPF